VLEVAGEAIIGHVDKVADTAMSGVRYLARVVPHRSAAQILRACAIEAIRGVRSCSGRNEQDLVS
jgi:hypothetical protein